MFIPKKVKGFNKLNAADKDLFKRFCTRFYKAWEYPEDHVPVKISRMDSKYLKVTLNDGDWLHRRLVLKGGRELVFENMVALLIAAEKKCPQEVAFKYLDRYLENRPDFKKIPKFKWTPQGYTRCYEIQAGRYQLG